MRNKLSTLFGYLLPVEESIQSYLQRMAQIGHLDQLAVNKLMAIMFEEIEKIQLDIVDLKARTAPNPTANPAPKPKP